MPGVSMPFETSAQRSAEGRRRVQASNDRDPCGLASLAQLRLTLLLRLMGVGRFSPGRLGG